MKNLRESTRRTVRSMVSTSVMIADDHPAMRRGIRAILEEAPDIEVVGEAGSARELFEQLQAQRCDVLLLDLTMPGTHELETVATVKRERPDMAVLVLTMHPEDQYAVRSLQSGAAGYLTKENAPEELVRAVRKVQSGGRYVTPQAAELLATRCDPRAARPPHERLSNREYQVLRLLGTALSVKQIAQELHLSAKTVSTYRTRLLEKIPLNSTAQLIRYAIEHKMVN